MNTKPIRLSPKKGGNGYISSYSVNLGITEVKDCGFIDDHGNLCFLEKVIDPQHHQIILRLADH